MVQRTSLYIEKNKVNHKPKLQRSVLFNSSVFVNMFSLDLGIKNSEFCIRVKRMRGVRGLEVERLKALTVNQ